MFDIFKKKRQEKSNQIASLQRLFDQETLDGQNALKYILSITHIQDNSFDEDQYRTAFNEGERNIGLQIVRALGIPYHKLMTIINETEESE